MNVLQSHRWQLRIVFVVLLWSYIAQGVVVRAHTIPAVYLKAYHTIHAESTPEWKGMTDVDVWIEQEGKAIEELALEWLRAGDGTVQWRRGLFLGRKLATPAICNLVFESMRADLANPAPKNGPITEDNHRALAGPIAVLAECGDTRALPALHQLIVATNCPRRYLDGYLRALRKIGNATSIDAIKELANRQNDTGLQRQVVLTERVLVARMAGRDLLKNSEMELRTLTRAWIQAVEAQDMQAYLNVLPSSVRGGIDEHDFKVELLRAPELPEILKAAKKAADAEDDAFRLDRDRLDASIVVDGCYRFLYVLEVDGWKISGPIRVGP